MRARILLPALTATLLLAACGSAKDANDGNFAKAINAHFAKHCITIRPGGFMNGNSYPASIALVAPNQFRSAEVAQKQNDENTHEYEVLVKAGLLSAADGTAKESAWSLSGNDTKQIPAKVYSLTDAGKKALADPAGKGTELCAGHYKVDEIVRFTPPASAMGATVSQVSYTFSPTDVPAWAESEDVKQAYPQLAQAMTLKQKNQTDLILASDGWIEGSDFNQ